VRKGKIIRYRNTEGQVARQTNHDGSLTTLPSRREDCPVHEGITLDHQVDRTEHVLIINHQVQYIGWGGRAANQFAVLTEPNMLPTVAEEPSEVDPNA
jgi:hypothetical protein